MKTIILNKTFKCYADNSEEVNFDFCRRYCMYYQGNTYNVEKNPWFGCYHDEEKENKGKDCFNKIGDDSPKSIIGGKVGD